MPLLSHTWLILILVLVLIVFGPGKLPQIGSALGGALRGFQKATAELKDEVTRATQQHDGAQTAITSNAVETRKEEPEAPRV